ncbi:hypothetical protein [Chamaesiphon sp. VAR_48_metabat_403]|uniref:hypothetical protein n=1 Tax=Chamaesiphon sp. VAR_48_metabat_403 TaxID=2964700 RepID=UPI00286E9A4E|nr:hypothetical protein [Chamaesiphon sp. VAR_48_metabat_403]
MDVSGLETVVTSQLTVTSRDRVVAFDRVMAIGDAASLQSPLIFTGFGSLVRNLPRLTHRFSKPDKHLSSKIDTILLGLLVLTPAELVIKLATER